MTLIFTSVTYAIKAQRLLAASRIHTSLSRSAAVTAVRGCGYGLRLAKTEDLEKAKAILAQNGVHPVATVKE